MIKHIPLFAAFIVALNFAAVSTFAGEIKPYNEAG
jgi:hypothetical protein